MSHGVLVQVGFVQAVVLLPRVAVVAAGTYRKEIVNYEHAMVGNVI